MMSQLLHDVAGGRTERRGPPDDGTSGTRRADWQRRQGPSQTEVKLMSSLSKAGLGDIAAVSQAEPRETQTFKREPAAVADGERR